MALAPIPAQPHTRRQHDQPYILVRIQYANCSLVANFTSDSELQLLVASSFSIVNRPIFRDRGGCRNTLRAGALLRDPKSIGKESNSLEEVESGLIHSDQNA